MRIDVVALELVRQWEIEHRFEPRFGRPFIRRVGDVGSSNRFRNMLVVRLVRNDEYKDQRGEGKKDGEDLQNAECE